MTPPPPISTLFPYTTLFRSDRGANDVAVEIGAEGAGLRVTDPKLAAVGERAAQLLHVSHQVRPAGEVRLHEVRSEEHTSELQSHSELVCRLLLEKKNVQKLV